MQNVGAARSAAVLAALAALAGCGSAVAPQPNPLPASSGPAAKRELHRQSGSVGVSVHPGTVLAKVSPLILGAGMAVWYDVARPGIAAALAGAGLEATRFPGGKATNWYHWATNSDGPGICQGNPNPDSTFDNFMHDIAIPDRLDVAITVNYGSNPQCNGGGDPSEAAAWVAYANATQGYGVRWWTVGNEQWASGSLDLNSQPHSPTQYAQLEAANFYPAMKAASPQPINVCVGVNPKRKGWDPVVLSQGAYDCVDYHYYAQSPLNISDQFLLQQAVPNLHQYLQTIQSELAAANHPNTPIVLGEIGSSTSPPGKQTQSIVQALFAGEVIGELVNDGIARATWHIGYGSCNLPAGGGSFGPGIYGWQNWGGAMIFTDHVTAACPSAPAPPENTPLATARAYQVLAHFAHAGESALATTVASMPDVQAWSTTDGGGYAVLLINTNQTATEQVGVSIDGKSSGKGGTVTTYDKSIYDQTKNNLWNGPTTGSLPAWNGNFSVSLPPWSMTVVETL